MMNRGGKQKENPLLFQGAGPLYRAVFVKVAVPPGPTTPHSKQSLFLGWLIFYLFVSFLNATHLHPDLLVSGDFRFKGWSITKHIIELIITNILCVNAEVLYSS